MSFDYSTEAVEKWKLDTFMNIINEFEDDFASHANKKRSDASDYEIILIYICGKVLVTTREMLTLCACGYPDGALSLTRNLYEQLILVCFFEYHKKDANFQEYVDNFFLSYDVQRNKSLRSIEKNRPLSCEKVTLDNEYQQLKQQTSKEIKGDYWWTGFPNFTELAEFFIGNETDIGTKNLLCKLYGMYKRACVSLHASCMGNALRLGRDANLSIVDTNPTLYGQSTPLSFASLSLIHIICTICLTFDIDHNKFKRGLNELAIYYAQQEPTDISPL